MTDSYCEKSFVSKTLAISDNKNNLKRRIILVKLSDGFIKHKLLIAIIVVLVIASIGLVFLTTPKVENSNSPAISSMSEDDAMYLGASTFATIKDYYWSWMGNHVENDGEISKINEVYTRNIQNICTENGFKQFLEFWDLHLLDDNFYSFGVGVGANPRYISDELRLESIGENELVFTDVVKYDDDPAIKENKFVLVREGQNWLVEDFTSPF